MEAYFDNSATTRCFDEVKDIVCKTMTGDFGNPSAMHKKGMEAENYVRKSAQTLAKLLKVNEKRFFLPPVEQNQIILPLSAAWKPTSVWETISLQRQWSMRQWLSLLPI